MLTAVSRSCARNLLQTHFGYSGFRPRQEAIIEHVARGGNALVLMPTSAGKSLCFQLPALLRAGTAIVVSPLIALMQDQVTALREANIRAAFLNSSQHFSTQHEVIRSLMAGELDLLYIAPERLVMAYTLGLLDELNRHDGQQGLALFAIDEAHCLAHWGHDFRQEYRQLSLLAERYPNVPRIALTATASADTIQEIRTVLQLQNAPLFFTGFDRPNIRYSVQIKNKPKQQLLSFMVNHRHEAGIIYCGSYKQVDSTVELLRQHEFKAIPYYAALSAECRQNNQARFQAEDDVVVVSTTAFGMGINKSNVRFVAHLTLPKCLETYYQETGRAGRDGLAADAWLIFSLQDAAKQHSHIANSDLPEEQKERALQRFAAMHAYCETPCCRRQVLIDYFSRGLANESDARHDAGNAANDNNKGIIKGNNDRDNPADHALNQHIADSGMAYYGKPSARKADSRHSGCDHCDNCLQPPHTFDGTVAAQKALSAICRTRMAFGVAHLTDLLRGNLTDKIREYGHDRLPTFGVGKEFDAATWKSIFRQLAAAGYVTMQFGEHSAMQLTAAAQRVLKKQERVTLRGDNTADSVATMPSSTSVTTPTAATAPCDTALMVGG